MNSFGERLAHALSVRGMTQKDLAERAGLSQGQVSHLINDQRGERISYELLIRICDALDVSDRWLYFNRGPAPRASQSPEKYPNRGHAAAIARAGGMTEEAVSRVEQEDFKFVGDPTVLWWLERMQSMSRLCAPPGDPTPVPPTPPPVTVTRRKAEPSPTTKRNPSEGGRH